jgi:hypothetical protein
MNKPLDELYLEWLYSQAADPNVKDPRITYWKLFKQLFQKEFAWIIPNDDNRMEDGKELRRVFAESQDFDILDEDWFDLGCSFLELMVGLSRKLAFEGGGESHYWFWDMAENLKLKNCTDARQFSTKRVDDIMDNVIWRQYEPDGKGGFFPLTNPREDQRGVELWYQISAYVVENWKR